MGITPLKVSCLPPHKINVTINLATNKIIHRKHYRNMYKHINSLTHFKWALTDHKQNITQYQNAVLLLRNQLCAPSPTDHPLRTRSETGRWNVLSIIFYRSFFFIVFFLPFSSNSTIFVGFMPLVNTVRRTKRGQCENVKIHLFPILFFNFPSPVCFFDFSNFFASISLFCWRAYCNVFYEIFQSATKEALFVISNIILNFINYFVFCTGRNLYSQNVEIPSGYLFIFFYWTDNYIFLKCVWFSVFQCCLSKVQKFIHLTVHHRLKIIFYWHCYLFITLHFSDAQLHTRYLAWQCRQAYREWKIKHFRVN